MWQIVGHEWAVTLLEQAFAAGHMTHTYLFTGPANIGKTTLARELAAALQCTSDAPPCGVCSSCSRIARNAHPDVTQIEPEAGKIRIEQVRTARRNLALSPYEGRWRICTITEFQMATLEAANALLKTLEEPPSRVILVLTALDVSLLLPTVVSRCQVVPLRGVPSAQIEHALVERWHQSTERAQLIARICAGRIGWAVRATQDETLLAQRQQSLEELIELLSQGRAARLQAAERLSERSNLSDILQLWQSWWRDLVLMSCGCEESVVNLDHIDRLRQLTRDFDLGEAERAARGVEATLQQIEQNVNSRLSLEVLLLGWRQSHAA